MTGVLCPPLVLPGQAQWAPCCLYASLVVAPCAVVGPCVFSIFPVVWSQFLGGEVGGVGWWGCVVLT